MTIRSPSPEPVKLIKTKDFQDEAPINWGGNYSKSPNRNAQAVTQYTSGAANGGFNVTDSISLRSLNGESPDAFLKKTSNQQHIKRQSPAPMTLHDF